MKSFFSGISGQVFDEEALHKAILKAYASPNLTNLRHKKIKEFVFTMKFPYVVGENWKFNLPYNCDEINIKFRYMPVSGFFRLKWKIGYQVILSNSEGVPELERLVWTQEQADMLGLDIRVKTNSDEIVWIG